MVLIPRSVTEGNRQKECKEFYRSSYSKKYCYLSLLVEQNQTNEEIKLYDYTTTLAACGRSSSQLCLPIILVTGRLREEDNKFEAILGYNIAKPHLEKKVTDTKQTKRLP